MPSPRRYSVPEAAFDSAWTGASEIAEAVAAGRVSAAQVTEDALARIARRNDVLNAFTDVTAERARTRAQAVDAARAAKQPLGPLAGVPVAV